MSQEGREDQPSNAEARFSQTPLQRASAPFKPQLLPQILVVDDDLDVLSVLDEFLRGQFIVRKASTGREAIEKIRNGDPQILLTDFRLPDTDGLELIRRALQAKPSLHIFLMTGKGTAHLKNKAFKQGALRFLEKPLNLEHLRRELLEIAHKNFGWAGNGIDVLDLTQIMSLCRKNGVLQFGEEGRRGHLVFQDGQVVHASAGTEVGEEAFYAMTFWRECPFQTLSGARPELKHNIAIPTEALVLEGARLRDEREFTVSAPAAPALPRPPLPRIDEETARQVKEFLFLLLEEDSVDTALLMDPQGAAVEFASKQGNFNPQAMEALLPNCLNSNKHIGSKLHYGEPTFATYEFEHGTLLIKELATYGVLVLLLDTAANVGLVRLQIRKVAPKLEALL